MVNLGLSGGVSEPLVFYKAKEGSFVISDGSGGYTPVDMSSFLMDANTLQTGWGYFPSNGAPMEITYDVVLGQAGQRPSNDHNRAFSVYLYTSQLGWVKWASNSVGACTGINEFFTGLQVEEDLVLKNPDNVMQVKYADAREEQYGKGKSSIIPIFEFVKILSRSELPAEAQTSPVVSDTSAGSVTSSLAGGGSKPDPNAPSVKKGGVIKAPKPPAPPPVPAPEDLDDDIPF